MCRELFKTDGLERHTELLGPDPKPKRLKKPESRGEKRKAEDEKPLEEEQSGLQEALRSRGPDAVDGTPLKGSSGSNECTVPDCVLPGGHEGHHRDDKDEAFLYDPYEGRKGLVEDKEEDISDSSSTSSSSSSSEELIPDGEETDTKETEKDTEEAPEETFYVWDLNVNVKDFDWLAKHCKKRSHAEVWLSKKMSEKGKEVEWSKLSLEEKKNFDLAMATEISNVVVSKALRNLTPEESKKIDINKVMKMRWVLTWKGEGTAKARLVVLGFQAHNLTEVATTSPTMSKVGRNCILALTAAFKFVLKSGDVTSAFLQTGISLEDEELTVLAPPELATMFGAEPGDKRALRVREAFYGLAHAPRKWWERCVATMVKLGWRQMLGDKCLFVLYDDTTGSTADHSPKVIGLAGIHVDDFLLSGDESSQKFLDSEAALQKEFRWRKWEKGEFEFAGCTLKQKSDRSIVLDQEKYSLRWIDEIEIDKTRSSKATLTPAETTALRGALGTISWRATQSGPQFLAEVSLLLSEVSKGTVETLYKTNKLIREMRREAAQGLSFPAWDKGVSDLAVVTWADASQHNRPDKSSTIGIVTAIGPKEILKGEECQLALVQWKSGKTPRQCLGSNGAEVQSITIGEDQNYHIRLLLAELSGEEVRRDRLHEIVKKIPGALVMDSRGIYDAMTRNLSALHGLRDSRSGYELTLAVNQALRAETQLRWVNGLAQIGDSLTKHGARKVLLQFFSQKQFWRLVHDPKFEAGRKVHKKEMERRLKEAQALFVNAIKKLADECNWPWSEGPEVSYDPYS